MSPVNTARFGTAFCEAIDAAEGVTTGISAYDRSHTIRVAMDPNTRPQDLARPGHVFPLARARRAGFWFAPDRPKRPSIWRAWRASHPAA